MIKNQTDKSNAAIDDFLLNKLKDIVQIKSGRDRVCLMSRFIRTSVQLKVREENEFAF